MADEEIKDKKTETEEAVPEKAEAPAETEIKQTEEETATDSEAKEECADETAADPEEGAKEDTKEEPKEKRGFFTARKMNSEIEKVKKKLSDAEKELEKANRERDDYLQLLQRNQADFENFRRRNNNVRQESIETGRREVLTEMLAVLDDLERVAGNPGNADPAFAEGVQLVYKKFLATLQKQGVEPLDESGKFDPNLHNAVLSEKVDGVESETILAVLQKGYKVGDKIIRHSMVKVAE